MVRRRWTVLALCTGALVGGCHLVFPFGVLAPGGDAAPGEGRGDGAGRADHGALDAMDLSLPVDLVAGDQSSMAHATIRRGTCAVATGKTLGVCPLAATLKDATRAFFIFQASSNNSNPHSSAIRCYLSSSSEITCDRFSTSGTVLVSWQLVELAAGIKVQHLQPKCNVDGDTNEDETVVKIGAVADTRTFLLHSHRTAGVTLDGNDPRTVRLVPPDKVVIEQTGYKTCAAGGSESALQVVELAGASVTRGLTGVMTAKTLTVGSLAPVETQRTLLLYSYRTYNHAPTDLGSGLVRGRITDKTTLTFSRGSSAGSQIDAIAWERVQLPAGAKVQQVDVTATATATASKTITKVAFDRSIALAGGQWSAGQALGETSYTSGGVLGVVVGRHDVISGGTQLRISRDAALGTASWTSFVVELP